MHMAERRHNRRQFLAATLGVGVVGCAGCLSSSDLPEAGKQPFESNPVSRNIDNRPRLGPPRSETDITVVTFDDASCPGCSKFHDNAFSEIRSNWVDEGKATVYTRQFPYVSEWAVRASHALVEVQKREPDDYWSLASSYYDAQASITKQNIYEKTRVFLENTSVNADAVVSAARNTSNRSYINTDMKAGEEAGVYGVPTNFLFQNGEFVTVLFNRSFMTFRAALYTNE